MASVSLASLLPVLLLFLLSGAGNTLIASWMDSIRIDGNKFDHPFVQCWVMFLGEASCLAVFTLKHLITKSRRTGVTISPWRRETLLFAIPCCFDWASSTMVYISYTYLPASVVQMLRGSLIIFVCLISVFVLKNKLYAHHFVGVGSVLVGIFLVALSSILQGGSSTTGKGKNPLVGVCICITAQMFASGIMTSEEFIFKRIKNIEPLQAVGIEGGCGITFGVVILTVAQLLRVDNVKDAIYDITHSKQAASACVLLACSIAVFNVCGQKITKNISAMARSALDSSRTILVWGAELAFGWRVFAYDTLPFWVQPFGFVFIVLGQMLYFNTIKIRSLMGPEEIAEMEQKAALEKAEQTTISTTADSTGSYNLDSLDLEMDNPVAPSRDARRVPLVVSRPAQVAAVQ
ncbi:unnamed protein product [Amoebophrya sp. A120]|nr:unnamed protein product [Amoebophrya sp. A120]|eukprot:GSA120T00002080001.1